MIQSRFIHPFYLALGCGVSFILTSFAQQQGDIQLRFVSFPKSANPEPIELLVGDRKVIKIEVPTNSISPTYRVKRMSKWVLGESIIDEEGKPSFDIFGQVSSIASKKQLILVIRKGKNNSDGLELIPISDNASGFGGGKCFFMNASKVDIAGSVGGEKFALKPNKHAVIKPAASKQKRGKKYSYAYIFFRKNGKPKPFFSSTWRLNDKARNMVFIYHEPNNNRHRLHIIRDYL